MTTILGKPSPDRLVLMPNGEVRANTENGPVVGHATSGYRGLVNVVIPKEWFVRMGTLLVLAKTEDADQPHIIPAAE